MQDIGSDEDDWRELVEKLYAMEEKPLYNVVYRWVWNEQESIDIVQEAFLAFWRRRPDIDPSKHRPYIWKTALNMAANRLRIRKMRQFVGLDSFPLSVKANQEDGIESREIQSRVEKAMNQLSENHKRIVLLSHFSEMSHATIAKTLSIPIGTVASRLNRAQTKLKHLLEESE